MKRVLVVDDSATIRQQVSLALKQAGYEVLEAVDGLDGSQKIAADPRIVAVICDINMPRMDGLAMVEKVQADKSRPAPAIIMLTTEGSSELMQRAKKAGAKGWMIKPFKAELLVAAVTKLVA
jgi:two-component system chemotaxis response regulator CheY